MILENVRLISEAETAFLRDYLFEKPLGNGEKQLYIVYRRDTQPKKGGHSEPMPREKRKIHSPEELILEKAKPAYFKTADEFGKAVQKYYGGKIGSSKRPRKPLSEIQETLDNLDLSISCEPSVKMNIKKDYPNGPVHEYPVTLMVRQYNHLTEPLARPFEKVGSTSRKRSAPAKE